MKLKKKYGLLTAICMVVGIVIGSGVFYKAQDILNKTEGNVTLGVIAWIIGGVIMVICACTFGIMATKYSKVNGVMDYAEETVGERYAYFIGWFMSTIYTPAMTSVLGWVSARYFGEIFGWHLASKEVIILGILFIVLSFVLNYFSPKLAGLFQISTTMIKLIPLVLMAVVGLCYGLVEVTKMYQVVGNNIVRLDVEPVKILISNFGNGTSYAPKLLLAATVMTAFAYEGWILATSINSELFNSKKSLPLALFFGSIIIIIIYIAYYLGVAGGAPVNVLMAGGSKYAFLQIFGDVFGKILQVFVCISCLGTLNGLMVACSRNMYSLAVRNSGPAPKTFAKVDSETNMPTASSLFALGICLVWYLYFAGAVITTINGNKPWFGKFSFDSSELPIITIYGMYIPVFIMMIKKERKSLGVFKGVVMPCLAIVSCLFMVVAAIIAHEVSVVFYLILFAVIMSIGIFFMPKKNVSILPDSIDTEE